MLFKVRKFRLNFGFLNNLFAELSRVCHRLNIHHRNSLRRRGRETVSRKRISRRTFLQKFSFHSEIKHEEPHRIHTIHHHHIQKYTVIKKIEVPVIKEVKVPYKVYVFHKVPYKFYVKPLIVKVPIEYFHTKAEEHEEKQEHHEEHHEENHEAEDHHN